MNLETFGINVQEGYPAFVNQTRIYLLPCLRWYGLQDHINFNHLMACGVQDVHCPYPLEVPSIFLLFSYDIGQPRNASLEQLSATPACRYRYEFGILGEGLLLEMYVMYIPVAHFDDYEHFLAGSYSQMYDSKARSTYFKLDKRMSPAANMLKTRARQVLFKSETLRASMMSWLEENPQEKRKRPLGDELDFPPDWKNEVFNYV